MKKIILLSPPYLKDYMRNARCDFVSLSHTQWFPIWLGYLGSFLEKKGYTTRLIDGPAENLSHQKVYDIIKSFMPDLIVVYSGRMSEENDISFAQKLNTDLGSQVVFAGPYASIKPARLLKKIPFAKGVVKGEMERPILDLLQERPLKDIKGLVFYENAQVIQNLPPQPFEQSELNDIPFVSKYFNEQLNIKNYKAISEPYPYLDIMIGRGCAYGQCTYCLWVHTYICGARYNTRTVENVLEELKYIKKELPYIKSIMIQDDTFTSKIAASFSEGILQNNLKLKWSCYARGNMSKDVLNLMQKAGCLNLHVGYESANNSSLKVVKKGISKERMEKFTYDAHSVGLKIHADFAIGLPGETEKSVIETIEWAKKLKPFSAQFQMMIPFEGTPFYDYLKENGFINTKGEPDYPDLPNERLRQLAKKAYKSFYFSPHYLKRVICHPYEYFLKRFDTYYRAIPAIFWKTWKVQ